MKLNRLLIILFFLLGLTFNPISAFGAGESYSGGSPTGTGTGSGASALATFTVTGSEQKVEFKSAGELISLTIPQGAIPVGASLVVSTGLLSCNSVASQTISSFSFNAFKAGDTQSSIFLMPISVSIKVTAPEFVIGAKGSLKTILSSASQNGVMRFSASNKQQISICGQKGTVTLSLGSRNSQVLLLQKLLRSKGLNIRVDGFFGAQTKQLISAFQSKKQIPVTGTTYQKTWELLEIQ